MELKKLRKTKSHNEAEPTSNPPVPVGTYVAMIFRVVGYTPDTDKERTPLAKLENIDFAGNASGWSPDGLILLEDNAFILEDPADIRDIIE